MARGPVIKNVIDMNDAPYTEEEWEKIERLASEKGRNFNNADEARKYLEETCE